MGLTPLTPFFSNPIPNDPHAVRFYLLIKYRKQDYLLCQDNPILYGGLRIYCQNCGKEIDDSNYCKYCGHQTNCGGGSYNRPNYQVVFNERNVGLAVVLSILIVGAGHIYAGKIGKGITILVLWTVLSVPVLVLAFVYLSWTNSYASGLVLMIVLCAAYLVAWIWTIYDAMKVTQQYNEALRRTGFPPW
jgi:TM2 domain-containing membrane protein YozV